MSNESKILNLIKLGPSLIILITIITTYIIISSTNSSFDRFINEIEEELIGEKKLLVKREVERVYNYIDSENKETRNRIRENLKERVYEAYNIAKSLYENNQDKSEEEIRKLIVDSLRNIRFNEGRGYFFLFEIGGKCVLHPVFNHFEGKNFFNIKDVKGTYIVQKYEEIALQKGEGFSTWWWHKTKDSKEQYEKIGFIKKFKPLNFYIVAGEYVKDFEEELKSKLLDKINKIRFGNSGYIFIIDSNGTMQAHINKQSIGRGVNDKDENWVKNIHLIMGISQNGEGYSSYLNKNPSSGILDDKLSFIKAYKPWGWTIGSGVYASDLENEISKKRNELTQNNNKQLNQIIFLSFVFFTMIIIASIYFSNKVKEKFLGYKTTVKDKTNQLETLNENLETKVLERTKELESINKKLQETIKDLSKTKEDLILSQKMATLGELVSSVTHEINTPLGISITSNSHIAEVTKKTEKLYLNEEMSKDDFESCLADLKELSKIIEINLDNCVKLVRNFKGIAVDQALEEKREFVLNEYLEEILLALRSKTKKIDMKINIMGDKEIVLNSYPNYIFQIFTNLINNSIIHGFTKDKLGIINIELNDYNDFIEIHYFDNGKGIPKNIEDEVFNQYFTTKKADGGTGLGLYIIKKIVMDRLNGHIELCKSLDEGVAFLIKLPKKL